MEKVVLKATKRTVIGKQVSQLRREGQLPGVVYGHNIEPTPISLEAHSAGLIIPHLQHRQHRSGRQDDLRTGARETEELHQERLHSY